MTRAMAAADEVKPDCLADCALPGDARHAHERLAAVHAPQLLGRRAFELDPFERVVALWQLQEVATKEREQEALIAAILRSKGTDRSEHTPVGRWAGRQHQEAAVVT
eukprot:CAMPEP_0181170544 /NCGR_PEP_ID=MMETSP1096-20121128/1421_1 /TAXON_ID=156174 ORGANISM="Chrysochromulina ericina, Strain CCMP281" /NCGR_SAMPLE_ID=MMETSP1096 /ASSEMBLY_ACC=CAM_ASM_000453 /LENGTH=106 /DNA_ID=CAMNT_0023258109 /DNA_START=567 /DNA_END=888 /DNA_ORIENTATION=+